MRPMAIRRYGSVKDMQLTTGGVSLAGSQVMKIGVMTLPLFFLTTSNPLATIQPQQDNVLQAVDF